MRRRTLHAHHGYAYGRARGFTLVELMVSLVAGLIVTIAVVGLARTATTTFYEQARLSTTEGTVRSAAERLRQDLSRVAFMSTGNIQLARNDSPTVPAGQKISHTPGAATPSRYAATNDLQGIRIYSRGSYTTTTSIDALSDLNAVKPDAIEITGNLTTDDSYRGKMSGSNAVILTSIDDIAVERLLNTGPVGTGIRNAFTPGSMASPVPAFVARVVDPRGCQHFVVISDIVSSATSATITFGTPNAGSPVLTPSEDASTCGANDQEEVTISPVATARWYIGATTAALAPDPAIEPMANKFDLYREIRDANGTALAAPGGPQVVAEYAVDLKFGITVDDPTVGVVPPNNHVVFDMDDNESDVAAWTAKASSTKVGFPAPQRVRSVRFRLATRTTLADRQAQLPPAVLGKPYYMTRYCTDTATPCKKFARVRTIMSEVALLNQQGMSY